MSESKFCGTTPTICTYLASLLATITSTKARVLYVGNVPGALLEQQENSIVARDEQELAAVTGTFDFIVLMPQVLGTSRNVQALFASLQRVCTVQTRVVVLWQAWGWRPSLRLLRWLRLVPQEMVVPNGFSAANVQEFLALANFETITVDGGLLFPWKLPLVSWFYNSVIGTLPIVHWFGLMRWAVARPLVCAETEKASVTGPSVSVIIPCRNERGNIERAVQECPQMQARLEIIFVEGGSSDGTLEEIYRVQKAYPDRNIKVLAQTGKGKRNAVEVGFAAATGDILMILDADLTVRPADLVLFYQALVEGKGECINGSRLVYPLEAGAMQRLNFLVNHTFSWIVSWLLGQRVTDTLCGTKVFYRRDYERMVQAGNFFGDKDPFGDFDMLFGAAHANYKIVNVPICYYARQYGTTQIGEPWSWRRFAYGWVLLKLCWRGFRKLKVRS